MPVRDRFEGTPWRPVHRPSPVAPPVALLLVSPLVALLVPGNDGLAGPDPQVIQAATLRAHVEQLASDSFLGRGTGEVGSRLAEAYVAERFREFGLLPIPGEEDLFLDFPLYTRRPDTTRTSLGWRIDPVEEFGPGEEMAGGAETSGRAVVGQDFRPFPFSDSGAAAGGVVFAGYGISAPEIDTNGYDDYAGIDVRGRFVLVLRHEPGEDDASSPFDGRVNSVHALFSTKAAAAKERGALGMILVTDPLHHRAAEDLRLQSRLFLDQEEARRTDRGGDRAPGDDEPGARSTEARPFLAVHVSREVAEALLTPSGTTLESLQEKIDRSLVPESFPLPEVRVSLSVQFDPGLTEIQSRNVAGLLPGRDPALRDEWIVVSAHHDHLGAFEGPGDTIFNGADDNASGVAGVLELAEAFTLRNERPRRSLLFATFAAEEIGLLGSRAMVEQEQIPMDQVVFLLNLDMLGRNPENPVRLIGDGFAPGLAAVVDATFVVQRLEEEKAARAERRHERPLEIRLGGLEYTGDSDHAPFYARGVPFLTLFTGLHEDYHQLSDQAELIDFPRMESIVRLAGGILERVAEQPDALPFLHDISWLGIRVEARHGSDQVAAVSWIDDGSPAQQLGIRVGDLFASVNDIEADPPDEIGAQLSGIPPGGTAKISLRRGEEIFSVTATRAQPGYLGIAPAPVDEDTRRNLGLKRNEGVLVQSVVPGGPSEEAGIRRGDILVEISGHAVDDGSLRGRLAQIGAGERIDAVLVRDGARQTITVTLAERPRTG